MTGPERRQASEKLTDGPLPLYYQIANLIRNEILGGNWPSDSLLPTEDKLVKQYGVSRPTIRKAKTMLSDEGFIRSIKGSGSYVNGQETWKTLPPADATVAKHLDLKTGDAVLVVQKVYFDINKHPIEYVKTHYRKELPYSIRVKRN